MLIDRFGRIHNYLRISITENCNLRCVYCVPELKKISRLTSTVMLKEEVIEIAKTFATLGIKKIRLTGGEPLLRKDFAEIANGLSKLDVKLSITTNGVFLDKYLTLLKNNNFETLNISLDSLKKRCL